MTTYSLPSTVAPVRVGVIGCGVISKVYLRNCGAAPEVEVVACADLDLDRARARAEQFDIPGACSVDELLADPAVEMVLNLTVPLAHAEVSLRALNAGKHVYSEKPLATRREDGQRIIETAARHGLLVGCAPDTFMGAALQTCRQAIDDGLIGEPVAATAIFVSPGPESWHPDPAFLYEPGAGPLFDMAPYYLTALVALLGPIRRVSGSARISFPERTMTSKARYGEKFTPTTPTHVAALLEFAGGPIGTLVTSFDVPVRLFGSTRPRIEIYGSEGNLQIRDPNNFGDPVRLVRAGWIGWQDIRFDVPFTANWRGVGTVDMAHAIRQGGVFRANGALAFHVLDAMQAILESAEDGHRIELTSDCRRPDPMPLIIQIPDPDKPENVRSEVPV